MIERDVAAEGVKRGGALLACADMSARDVGVKARRRGNDGVTADVYNRLWGRIDWRPRRLLDPVYGAVFGAVDEARGRPEKGISLWRNPYAQD